jgi:hypothetical protein
MANGYRGSTRLALDGIDHCLDASLLCNTDRGWQNYWYGDVTEFHPDLDRWTMTLAFDGYAPLRLSGPAAPALSLWTASAVLGQRWVSDPRLARLLQ